MKNKSGFTLLELLVVIVIIGILATIALPQYNKAVLKAKLHRGIPLVENLYQAQQVYIIGNGNFSTDIDDLDVEIPKNDSSEKQQNSSYSRYTCDFGTIGLADKHSNIQYKTPNEEIIYLHYLTDYQGTSILYKEGSRWCYARSKTVNQVCIDLGGEIQGTANSFTSNKTNRYKLK